MSSKLTGGCACGNVRFEVAGPLGPAGYCHCKRCQRRSGAAASPQARVRPGTFALVAGEQLITEWQPEQGFVKAFCSRCGGHIYSRHPTDSEILSVRLGAFDGDPGVRPSHRQRLESAAIWEAVPDDGLARHDGPMPEVTQR